ncbi:MAG: sigma-70 family RNA polymerase sigma factor [Lentisphaeraceae bacterium]|nr:sigma-70 family RNA polymerase sigma factor [Lentisphaeraceae bacterium]
MNQDDESAWNELVGVYNNYIFVIIRKMNVPTDDCDDLLQQIFIKIWKGFSDFEYGKNRSKFRTWLGAVSHSVVYDYFRKKKSLSSKQTMAAEESLSSNFSSITEPEIEEIVEREWRIYISNLAMQNVKKIFSGNAIEAFELSMKEVPGEKIASQLGITLDSVYMLKSRVKKRLIEEIKMLKEHYE